MTGLTRKQAECLQYLTGYIRDNGGVSPTTREVMEALELASSSGVQRLLDGLEERGLIRRLRNRARSIELVSGPPPSPWKVEIADAVRAKVLARVEAGLKTNIDNLHAIVLEALR